MGITNEGFQTERDETPACQFATLPNDIPTSDGATGIDTSAPSRSSRSSCASSISPRPRPRCRAARTRSPRDATRSRTSAARLPHAALTTGNATVAALRNKQANLFSDLALHNMGPGLADDIVQGVARGDEFRTAPLWGLGKRLFFLHDGRAYEPGGGHPGSRQQRQRVATSARKPMRRSTPTTRCHRRRSRIC